MMEKVICDKCEHEMRYKKEGSSHGWFCDYCGWNVVTSFMEPIYEDVEIYYVFNDGVSKESMQMIKCIAQITGENFIMSKELLSKKGSVLYKGDAKSVKSILHKLTQNEIQFKVIPEFPYSIE